jgi:hypothetical protein
LPRITAGGSTADDQIKRVDISPEDIRQMSKDEVLKLLADLRAASSVSPNKPKSIKIKSPKAPKMPDAEVDEMEGTEEE